MNKTTIGILFFLFLLTINLHAQQKVEGKIQDGLTGEPLIGAAVIVKGTTIGTTTDFDGNFSFDPKQKPPFVISINFIGYQSQDFEVKSFNEKIKIKLQPSEVQLQSVEIVESRLTEKQKESPLTIESMDIMAIKETPASNFYEGLGTLKGVDLTSASLGFKIINTRGFNSTRPVRSLQLIDGVDNQAPGLNFSIGNFLGASELDIKRVELIVGASSGMYGPNAFNGVIDMETKSPFDYRGVSAQVRVGERALREVMLRYADAWENEKGRGIGFKINVAYLEAFDWVADNYDTTAQTLVNPDNPGGIDAVNIYGDENLTVSQNNFTDPYGQRNFQGLGVFHRTGYQESQLVDYNTKNLKLNGAVHAKITKKVEAIYAYNYGGGTTVYQGDNRYSLKNIKFQQHKVEVRQKDKFFVRFYQTSEDAGDSYDAVFTALLLQDSAKSNAKWSQDYAKYWQQNNRTKVINLPGYPNPNKFPQLWFNEYAENIHALTDYIHQKYADSLATWHNQARMYADTIAGAGSLPFFVPGTARFDSVFKHITSKNTFAQGGSRFFDKSALRHVQAEYKFTPNFMDITLGGSFRQYLPYSEGTIFSDTNGRRITNYEYGGYLSLKKRVLNERMILTATTRLDKNQNFDYVASPAASVVYFLNEQNIVRTSFSSAIRNPTLQDQFLYYNVGRAILIGNMGGYDSLITIESLQDYLISLNPDTLNYFNVSKLRPEKVKTVEAGFKGTIGKNVFIDLNYYYSWYKDFLGFKLGSDASFDTTTGFLTYNQVYRISANSDDIVTTQGFSGGLNIYFRKYFMLGGNYSWNRLDRRNSQDPIIPAFNTPEHKFNITLSGRDIVWRVKWLTNMNNNWPSFTIKNFGFSINYKWIQGFLFEGSPQFTGFVPTYDLVDAQFNFRIPKIYSTFKFGASNVLNNMAFQAYGGPRIGRLAYVSLLFELDRKN